MFVLTADQKRSTQRMATGCPRRCRTGRPRGPPTPAREGRLGLALPFERTVGDEIQGLLSTPAAAVRAVTELVRLGGWRMGIGVGAVEQPPPRLDPGRVGPGLRRGQRGGRRCAHLGPADLRVVAR